MRTVAGGSRGSGRQILLSVQRWFPHRNHSRWQSGSARSYFATPVQGYDRRFFHFDHQGGWSELIEAAANWGMSNGAATQSSWVLIEDEDKIALFESIGFDKTDSYGKIDVNGRKINTIKLVRK